MTSSHSRLRDMRLSRILAGLWLVLGVATAASVLGYYPPRSLGIALTVAGVFTIGMTMGWLVVEGGENAPE